MASSGVMALLSKLDPAGEGVWIFTLSADALVDVVSCDMLTSSLLLMLSKYETIKATCLIFSIY
jgi:hypothetical protein